MQLVLSIDRFIGAVQWNHDNPELRAERTLKKFMYIVFCIVNFVKKRVHWIMVMQYFLFSFTDGSTRVGVSGLLVIIDCSQTALSTLLLSATFLVRASV